MPQTPRVDTPARFTSLQWWLRDSNGNLALALWPNPALVVWFVTVVVRLTGPTS